MRNVDNVLESIRFEVSKDAKVEQILPYFCFFFLE